MWPRHEIGLDRTYYAYFLFSPMIERSQITPYHSKFVVRRVPSATLGKNAVDG
jgi:hypothetical protein